jgi:sugar/nucleoside kinase (ribokinase family)
MHCLPDGARVSFDPNIRPEVLSVEEIRDLCEPVVDRADVVLPSIGEAAMLTGAASDEGGCRQWADAGKLVVLKQGAAGCTLYSGDTVLSVPGYTVDEVDPTGAGDSFCAGITVGLLENMPLRELGRFANAVGALAVTRKGPMEGAPTRAQVQALMDRQP